MSQTSSQSFSNGAALLEQFGLTGRGAGFNLLAADLSAQRQSLVDLATKHYQQLNARHGGTGKAMADALLQTYRILTFHSRCKFTAIENPMTMVSSCAHPALMVLGPGGL